MGPTTERTDLLRILLADQDDANAFLFQCGVNRLSRPCAFQRVAARSQLPEKIQSFQPNIVLVAGEFAKPDEIREIKQHINGHPVICAVHDVPEGEAALEAGAADCVFVSQVDELHACIERHLSGDSKIPYFKKDFGRDSNGARLKNPSKLDVNLEKLDRWVGAQLMRLAKASQVKCRKLARVSRIACVAGYGEMRRRYRALRIQWLLHKQKRIVQSNLPLRNTEPGFGSFAAGSVVTRTPESNPTAISEDTRTVFEYREPPNVREVSALSATKQPSFNQEKPKVESVDNEALRTLELSFKTIFHTALDPMFLLDGLGSFLLANTPACALLGVVPADLLGKSLLDFVPASDRPQVSAMWEALLIEGQQKAETHLQSANGDLRDVLVSARTNLWFGVHLLVVRDQTELKSLRETLRVRQPAA